MRVLAPLMLAVSGCASSQNIGSALLDASVLGPRLAAARESRQITEERVSVSANWLSNTTLQVSGSGSPATAVALIEDRMALTAAQKAIESGFMYMVPINFKDTSVESDFTVNSPYETTISGETRGTIVGNTYRGATKATATTTGGPRSQRLLVPGRIVVFQMFEEKPPGVRDGQFFDAMEIYDHLGPSNVD